MITVYLKRDNSDSEEVLERTREMVLACEVTYPEENRHRGKFSPPCETLPSLRDDDLTAPQHRTQKTDSASRIALADKGLQAL